MKEFDIEAITSKINSIKRTIAQNKGRFDQLKKTENGLLAELKESHGVSTIEAAEELLEEKEIGIEKYRDKLLKTEDKLDKLMED